MKESSGSIIKSGNISLFYKTFGEGEDLLIAFHGFGRAHSDFQLFKDSLGKRFKVVAVDLFYHGQSSFPKERIEKHPLLKKELYEIINLLTAELNASRFSFLGFSLGGKVALCCLEHFAKQTDHLLLMAPDGIKTNFWYDLVTSTWIGQKIYKSMIPRANFFLQIAKTLKQLRIIHEKQFDFVQNNISTQEQRQFVYDVWMIYRKLQPKIKNITKLINNQGINTQLFFGKYDKIIPSSIGKKFSDQLQLQKHDILHELETGHGMMSLTVSDYLKNNQERLFPENKKSAE